MYILYVDASGTPNLQDPQSPLFVMAGVCIHESGWIELESNVRKLKSNYMFNNLDFELHAKDFCVSIYEQDRINGFDQMDYAKRREEVLKYRAQKIITLTGKKRDQYRKTYKSTFPFIHLSRSERSQLLTDALELIGDNGDVRLFAEVVDKKHANYEVCIAPAFTQIVSRFDAFLARVNRFKSSGQDHGLLVMDKEATHERMIEGLFKKFVDVGHPWGRIFFVIESPFFVDSAKAIAVQAVDLCSYVVRRYVERAHRVDNPEEQNFLRIFHRFDRAGPKLHGLRHYCERGSCNCLICKDRGHDTV